MNAKIVPIHGKTAEIGLFLRVGHNEHRQLEAIAERNRFVPSRIVIEASRFDAQTELIETVRDKGAEIVLDTTVGELSSIGRYDGSCKVLPWAKKGRPIEPEDLGSRGRRALAEKIGAFVEAKRIDTVLAPTHFVTGARDPWIEIDLECCRVLRSALDSRGLSDVTIDYPLIIPYSVLCDSAHRSALIDLLRDHPIENLWFRISHFGADARPVSVSRVISGLATFHDLGRPIVVDHVGGLAGLALVAFGAASAIAHGVGEKERFDARAWSVPRGRHKGGRSNRIYLPGIDRHFKWNEAQLLFNARGGRRLLACSDPDCCPQGMNDMRKDPKGHFLTQREKQVQDLVRFHEQRRIDRYLDQHLRETDRTARQAALLKVDSEGISAALQRQTRRLDQMRGVLEGLHSTLGDEGSRAEPLANRPRIRARRRARRY